MERYDLSDEYQHAMFGNDHEGASRRTRRDRSWRPGSEITTRPTTVAPGFLQARDKQAAVPRSTIAPPRHLDILRR